MVIVIIFKAFLPEEAPTRTGSGCSALGADRRIFSSTCFQPWIPLLWNAFDAH